MSASCIVTQPVIIDFDVFSLWLKGYTIDETVKHRLNREQGLANRSQARIDQKLIIADTLDCYRLFNVIEDKYLKNPSSLANQIMFDLPPDIQNKLIQEYYSFDKAFARELLGKKLSSRLRKDVDEIGEKARVLSRSCRRQLDNFRRVFKAVEDLDGSLPGNIQSQFLLSDKLTKLYVNVIFMASNKFETGKKRLQYITFDMFMGCCKEIIENWTLSFNKDGDIEIDKTFIQDLRDLKSVTNDNIEQHRTLLLAKLSGKVKEDSLLSIGSHFKAMMRATLNIATGLVHSKEWKDIYNNMVEKVIEILRHMRIDQEQSELILNAFSETAADVTLSKHLSNIYYRYLKVFGFCLIQLYP
ncbi:Acidic fibroblast growth factor intracellular-binding protein B [Trichoplax sp. H2]|nr:Acidic fibroblast growth factor intracellular-binding protein B [Trichoplax sp. H2]|eukprot:RDD47374.1 Acidic fibroblast growth factor intracellular-binding protein B [Trichoplax sp. H2]